MTTIKQDEDFLSSVVGKGLLESAIDWIQSNLQPEEVFNDTALDIWATNQGYQKEPE